MNCSAQSLPKAEEAQAALRNALGKEGEISGKGAWEKAKAKNRIITEAKERGDKVR